MRRNKDELEKDLQAFFRACDRNGVSVSSAPKPRNHNSSVIVGINGERYRISPDMKVVPERRSIQTNGQGGIVINSGSAVRINAKKCLAVRGSHGGHVYKKRKKLEQVKHKKAR